MAIALQITDHWSDGKRIHVTGNLVITFSRRRRPKQGKYSAQPN